MNSGAPAVRDRPARYADRVMAWLSELGYTHCFFVAGGNIMHLLDGARGRFRCVPFVHEAGAGIAAEYFNAVEGSGKAFALVTAGPGLTNIVTAMAGAYLESRELVVIGGQVKSSDLATGGIRQRGIQEVDGVALAAPVCVAAARLERPVPFDEFAALVRAGGSGRPGPVFVEICLDAQGAPVAGDDLPSRPAGGVLERSRDVAPELLHAACAGVDEVAARLARARRPVLLLGGGVNRSTARDVLPLLRAIGVPVQTTWNGIDRIPAGESVYFGRPNTWGQRYANVILQQADLVIALGTRLGLQQTGFNWEQFVPLGEVVHVDIDAAELEKGHPRTALALRADANALLRLLVTREYPDYSAWRAFCGRVKALLPLAEDANAARPGYVDPYRFYLRLSELLAEDDVIVPCSSGGANSVALQAFNQRGDQRIVTSKGLASMGYGLSGAIGAALAWPERRTIVIEGDGGFAQNLQELGTVAVNALDLKIFILANDGYASIRTTQRNYFGGAYVGCDGASGLGLPDWEKLFAAYGIACQMLDDSGLDGPGVAGALASKGPAAFIVPVDPEQTYYPKISSRITASGGMESNPLHLMTPELPAALAAEVMPYLLPEPVAV